MAMKIVFSKFLTFTDVTSNLVVPTSSLQDFIGILGDGHQADLPVMDLFGKAWNFTIFTRPGGNHPKPILGAEWRNFAREKGLQVGDEAIFFESQDGGVGLGYMILVLRRPHLFTFHGEAIVRDVNELAPVHIA